LHIMVYYTHTEKLIQDKILMLERKRKTASSIFKEQRAHQYGDIKLKNSIDS